MRVSSAISASAWPRGARQRRSARAAPLRIRARPPPRGAASCRPHRPRRVAPRVRRRRRLVLRSFPQRFLTRRRRRHRRRLALGRRLPRHQQVARLDARRLAAGGRGDALQCLQPRSSFSYASAAAEILRATPPLRGLQSGEEHPPLLLEGHHLPPRLRRRRHRRRRVRARRVRLSARRRLAARAKASSSAAASALRNRRRRRRRARHRRPPTAAISRAGGGQRAAPRRRRPRRPLS